jgi:hypothetical protein
MLYNAFLLTFQKYKRIEDTKRVAERKEMRILPLSIPNAGARYANSIPRIDTHESADSIPLRDTRGPSKRISGKKRSDV